MKVVMKPLPVALLTCALALAQAPALAQATGKSMLAPGAHHRIPRPDDARLAFMQQQPCPATGQFTTNCPGWRVEFIVPLERGGTNTPSNMKWERTDVTRPAS